MNKFIISFLLAAGLLACQPSHEQNSPRLANGTTSQPVFTRISKRLITDIVECTGRIDVPPNQRAALYTPIGAVVSDIRVLPGDLVQKGQKLFTLTHQNIVKVQEDYLIARSSYETEEVNLERKKVLYDNQSISQREYRTAQHRFNVARARYLSLREQLTLIGLSPAMVEAGKINSSLVFRAPINGFVAEIMAVSGSYIDVNSPILTLVNTDHKHVELQVYADQINRVKPGQEVRFHLAGNDTEYQAYVHLVGKEVQEDTRTITVHAHLHEENDPSLIVGSYLYAGILVNADSLYSLPEDAVVQLGDKQIVLLQENDNLVPYQVQTGKTFKGYVHILNYQELLNKNIVAKDAYYLYDAQNEE